MDTEYVSLALAPCTDTLCSHAEHDDARNCETVHENFSVGNDVRQASECD
jgi:hypothetical protein